MNTTLLIQLLVNGLIVGALYGVVAMCFVLIYKASQVVNFAQGEFVLIGAWAVGPQAGEWIHQASLAIRTQLPLETLLDQVAQFPTYHEAYQAALEQLEV